MRKVNPYQREGMPSYPNIDMLAHLCEFLRDNKGSFLTLPW